MPLTFHQLRSTVLRRLRFFALLTAALAEPALLGCASPGAPVTRNTQQPQPVADLSAAQSGNSIVLSFSLPTKTVRGQDLAGAPTVEIYRSFETASRGNPQHSVKPRLLATIPPQMVARYNDAGRITFPDMITLQDLAAHSGGEAVYEVRTRVGRSNSLASNSVRILILPAPQPIHDLRAQIVDNAIELAWSAPEILSAGSAQPALTYNLYREVSGSSAAQSSNAPSSAGRSVPAPGGDFKLLGQASQPSYTDATAESGRTYAYVVRTAAKYVTGSVESQDSNQAELTFSPMSRPAAPEHLVATIASANQTNPLVVELSWAISPETDLAGYNVYRSDTESAAGTRVNSALILIPVFRDSSAAPGQEYFYRVTAVNRAGSESEPSAPVRITVPKQP